MDYNVDSFIQICDSNRPGLVLSALFLPLYNHPPSPHTPSALGCTRGPARTSMGHTSLHTAVGLEVSMPWSRASLILLHCGYMEIGETFYQDGCLKRRSYSRLGSNQTQREAKWGESMRDLDNICAPPPQKCPTSRPNPQPPNYKSQKIP